MSIESLWPFGQKKKKAAKQSDAIDYSTSTRVHVSVDQLTLGMYVTELDRPWVDTPFLFQGFELKTEADIRAVRDVCDHVYIDATKHKRVFRVAPVAKKLILAEKNFEIANYGIPPKKLGHFEKEIGRAEKIYDNAETVVANFMRTVENGGGIDSILAKIAVSECVESILHSPDAMLWLTQLKHKDEQTAQHSLNVSILSIVLGRHINLPPTELNKLGLCGMMHDVGKLLIPPEILHKSTPLDEDEIRIMKTHTRLGYNLLKSSDNMNASAATVALTHHEQVDGRGYPRRLQDAKISHFAKIVAIANSYDGMTTDKPHQKGKTHLEATHILTNLAGTHFDPALVVKFIECIGVYPPGSLVELTNGCVAMVVEVNEQAKLRPKVIVILDENKNQITEHVIDLSTMPEDARGQVYTIRSIIKARDWNVDVSKYYQQGLLQKSFAHKK
jgi:HD-GYP domain-containing protein (c-di-GMP phosphodiesterase class II)